MDDDDDTSWKVRRGAVSVLAAIIKTRPDFHRTILDKYSVGIVRRFRERVDDVKIELMEAYDQLLLGNVESQGANSLDLELKNQASLKHQSSNASVLAGASGTIVSCLLKELKSKNLKVRIQIFTTLSNLALALQFDMDKHFADILPEIEKTVQESQSYEPLLAALRMMRRLFRSKPFGAKACFLAETDRIVKVLKASLQHEYSKVVSEALRATGSFLNALRTVDTSTISSTQSGLAQSLYELIVFKLEKVDID